MRQRFCYLVGFLQGQAQGEDYLPATQAQADEQERYLCNSWAVSSPQRGSVCIYGGMLEQSIRSFDRVTDQRILRAQPDRLKTYTAREGDTLTAIAQRTNNPRANADQLAILNRFAVSQPITPGRMVKIVERGY